VFHAASAGRGGGCRAGELDERTATAAHVLARAGLTPGDRLLWSARPSVPAVVALLAAWRAGAVVVPLNPASTGREVAHVVGDVRPAVAVVDDAGTAELVRAASAEPDAVGGKVAIFDTDLWPTGAPGRRAAGGKTAGPLDAVRPEDHALIVYTSGTTGQPKGAVLTHANLAAGAAALQLAWDWTSDDQLVLALPLFHVHGLVAGLLGSLSVGASMALVSPFEPGAVLEAAGGTSTMFFGVPTMYHRLLAHGGAGVLARLRLCVSGSAPLAPSLWHRLRAEAGTSVLERYGMSETLMTLSNPLVGERRPGVETRLDVEGPHVGAAAAERVAPGVEGELWVRGPTVCAGYWERPAATDAAFAGSWFKTGDVAARDGDGYHTILGRRGDLVISGGHNVYPAEVEDVLLAHPAVAEVAVTGTPSEEWGEAVTAYVVAAESPFPYDQVAAFAAERLSSFKRPRIVRVIDSLPRNAMGKVRRDALG
jgi:malonyl-CoA/methylmalonyl-CoA synthetase